MTYNNSTKTQHVRKDKDVLILALMCVARLQICIPSSIQSSLLKTLKWQKDSLHRLKCKYIYYSCTHSWQGSDTCYILLVSSWVLKFTRFLFIFLFIQDQYYYIGLTKESKDDSYGIAEKQSRAGQTTRYRWRTNMIRDERKAWRDFKVKQETQGVTGTKECRVTL